MKKWEYYIRSENEDTGEIKDFKIDRTRYMSIKKYLINYKGMREDYCSKSKTKFISGNQEVLIYRKETK